MIKRHKGNPGAIGAVASSRRSVDHYLSGIELIDRVKQQNRLRSEYKVQSDGGEDSRLPPAAARLWTAHRCGRRRTSRANEVEVNDRPGLSRGIGGGAVDFQWQQRLKQRYQKGNRTGDRQSLPSRTPATASRIKS